MRLLSESAFRLEFQNCVEPRRPLIAAGALLERLALVGQRMVIANFRRISKPANGFGRGGLNSPTAGNLEVGRMPTAEVAGIARKAGSKV